MTDQEPRIGTELQTTLTSGRQSALKTYQDLFIGRRSLWATFKYEAIVRLCQGTSGAWGLFWRKVLYRRLFRQARGVVFGRNVTVRHGRKITIGRGTVIDDDVVLDAKGPDTSHITIGENCYIGRGTILSCKGGSIEIGAASNFGAYCQIQAESPVIIGCDVLFAGYVYVVAGGNHDFIRIDIPIIRQPMVRKGGIRIGDDCWLAARVTVLDGAHVGRGSVIGAGAIVTKPIPDYSVAFGAPAVVRINRQGEG
jgi:acetyltransferase-like isoleucine patch superfamily enzyme